MCFDQEGVIELKSSLQMSIASKIGPNKSLATYFGTIPMTLLLIELSHFSIISYILLVFDKSHGCNNYFNFFQNIY